MREYRSLGYVKIKSWECFNCHAEFKSPRRLDRCPVCGEAQMTMMH